MGFKFNLQHNNDIGLIMDSKSIQSPSKKKIKEDVPFMNSSYDFSTVGSNGEITYTDRIITVVLGLPTRNKTQLHILYSKALQWLVDVGQSQLIFDDILDYYFLAEVEGISTFEEIIKFGKLTVTFTCEPFKMGVSLEGSEQLWDTFNFETDILQDSSFDVVGTKIINITNAGRLVCPTINANANMNLIFDSKTYSLMVGDNKFYNLKLQNGANSIVINGNGHIKFLFRKVSL